MSERIHAVPEVIRQTAIESLAEEHELPVAAIVAALKAGNARLIIQFCDLVHAGVAAGNFVFE